jgi:tetratricopeptide (TPR) repeat protein
MARSLLARLRGVPVERAWRPILEGALLEARAGNDQVARKVFKYLIKHVPWYGPVFQEAFRFECRCEQYHRAVAIVEQGLAQNPRYGPLWFSALRLYEITAQRGELKPAREIVTRATTEISRELVWKIYFEAAQMEERAGNSAQARRFYVRAVEVCPPNLLWKVWVAGARTEVCSVCVCGSACVPCVGVCQSSYWYALARPRSPLCASSNISTPLTSAPPRLACAAPLAVVLSHFLPTAV